MDKAAARTYSAILAASSNLVSKHAVLRSPPPPTLPGQLSTPHVNDIPSLLRGSTSGRQAREVEVARATAAALHYSLAKRRTGLTERLLNPEGHKHLAHVEQLGSHREHAAAKSQRLRQARREKGDRTCRYCTLFNAMLYGSDPAKHPIEVVNHSAHVRASFDPDSNVSSAGIGVDGDDDPPFQVLVPEQVARAMIRLAHPLAWPFAAPDLFQETRQVRRKGNYWDIDRSMLDLTQRRDAWLNAAGPRYLYELVSWPWNEQSRAEIENVLRVDNFKCLENRDEVAMSYHYSLEECRQTSFGLGIERSGLDIDAGEYQGTAKRVFREGKGLLEKKDIEHVSRRDLVHMRLVDQYPSQHESRSRTPVESHVQQLARGWDPSHETLNDSVVDLVVDRARSLSDTWKGAGDYWLVSLRASKRLRFTTPVDGPPELWALLTWSAPALLFVFINRGTLQLPHFLADSLLGGREPVLRDFPSLT
jgi:hypothetical protein